MATYTKIAFHGAATVFILALIAAFLSYIVRLVLARNLAIEDFGLFYAVFSFLAFIGVFKTLGFDKAIIRFIPELLAKKKESLAKSAIHYAFFIAIATNAIIIALVFFASSFLSTYFFHTDKARTILLMLSLAFFAESLYVIAKNTFQGLKRMFLFSSIDIARFFFILIFLAFGFYWSDSIIIPCLAYLSATLLSFFLYFMWLKTKIFPRWSKYSFSFDKKLFKRMLKYGIIVISTGTSVSFLGYTDSMLLTYFSGLKAVALYNVALPLAKLFLFIGSAISSILLPLVAELYASKKIQLMKDGLSSIYKYVAIAVLPGMAVLLLYADLVITLFFGKEFIPASIALQILSIGMLFGILQLIQAHFFMGINKPKIYAKIFFIGCLVNFGIGIILVPLFNILGAAITISISYFIMAYFGMHSIRNYCRVSFPWNTWLRTVLATAIFIVTMALLKHIIIAQVYLEAIIVVSISGLVYAGSLFLFSVLSIQEIKTVLKRIRT